VAERVEQQLGVVEAVAEAFGQRGGVVDRRRGAQSRPTT